MVAGPAPGDRTSPLHAQTPIQAEFPRQNPMSTQRVATRTFPMLVLAVVGLCAGVAPAEDTLRPPSIRVRLLPPQVRDSCPQDPTPSVFEDGVRSGLDSGAFLLPDTGARARIAFEADTSRGRCGWTLLYRDPLGTVAFGDTASPGVEAIAAAARMVSDSVFKTRTGGIDVVTIPSNAPVWVEGGFAGTTPLRVEAIRIGHREVRVSLPGWAELAETLVVEPGNIAVLERELVRSVAWSDSVRRDSLWRDARARPAKDLAELFDRLAVPVATDPWVSVMVLPFESAGESVGYDPGTMVAEYGIARWKGDPRFVVLRREVLRRHIRSGAFAGSGSASDSSVAAMGQLVGARYVVTGTVQAVGGRQVIESRLVSVRACATMGAATVALETDAATEAYGEVLGDATRFPAILSRSVLVPGWGQFHAGRPVHGILAAGAVVASVGLAVLAWNDFSDKEDRLGAYRAHDLSTVVVGEPRGGWWRRAEEARKERNDAATWFGVSIGIVGAAWVANVADAAYLGRIESRKVRPRYYAMLPRPVVGADRISLAWGF